MSKNEFLAELSKGFCGLPQKDIEDRLAFYSEIIEERIEEGLSEEEAVSSVGSVEEIIKQVKADISFTKIAKERLDPKRNLKFWEIVFLVLGSPIWLSLVIALAIVIISIYVSLWSVICSLWAAFGALVCCSFYEMIAGVAVACSSNRLSGIAMLSIGLILLGLSIFMSVGCKIATKGILKLTKKVSIWIKNCFIKKEDAK